MNDAPEPKLRDVLFSGVGDTHAYLPPPFPHPRESTASSSSATMLVILIIGFTAGPDVSL